MPTITTKLYVGFGVLLALLLALGGLVAYDINGVHGRLRKLSYQEMPSLKGNLDLARNFATQITQAHLFLAGGEVWRAWEARSAGNLVDIELGQALITALPGDRADIRDLRRQMHELGARIQSSETLADSGQVAAGIALWDRRVAPLADVISDGIDQLRRRHEEYVLRTGADVFGQTEHLRIISQYTVIIALFAALLAIGFLARDIVVPIRKLVKAVDEVAEGDLSVRVEWPTRDEFGKLAADFNRMTDRVASTIQQLHNTQSTLQESNAALARAYHTLQQEMELAARIQRGILPANCSYLDVVVAADMEAASDIGGDFFDVLPERQGAGTLAVTIGDISGKGIAAALMMVFVVTILREICRQDATAAEVLQHLNQMVLSRFGPKDEMYATCFFGVLDRQTLKFVYSKAGHEEPIWYHAASGTCELLHANGLFVGTFSNGMYEDREIRLQPGDRLVLYTDGVVEARNAVGKLFGWRHLCHLVESCGDSAAGEIIQSIKCAVREWTDGAPLSDDITLLVMEIPGRQLIVDN